MTNSSIRHSASAPGQTNKSLAQSRPHELSLISVVLACWTAVFALAILLSNVFARADLIEMFLVTHCGVGIFMATMWTSFYGQLSCRRIIVGMATVISVASLGVALAWPQFRQGGDWGAFIYMPSLMMFIGLIPAWTVRRLLGWRIFHLTNIDLETYHSFSLGRAFAWTTFMAIVFAASKFVCDLLDYDEADSVEFFVMGIGIPAGVALTFLALLSRLKSRWMLLLIPLLAAFTAFLLVLTSAFTNDSQSFSEVMDDHFTEIALWFALAGVQIAAAVRFLRQRGVVFAFCRVTREMLERQMLDCVSHLTWRIWLAERVASFMLYRQFHLDNAREELRRLELPSSGERPASEHVPMQWEVSQDPD